MDVVKLSFVFVTNNIVIVSSWFVVSLQMSDKTRFNSEERVLRRTPRTKR